MYLSGLRGSRARPWGAPTVNRLVIKSLAGLMWVVAAHEKCLTTVVQTVRDAAHDDDEEASQRSRRREGEVETHGGKDTASGSSG